MITANEAKQAAIKNKIEYTNRVIKDIEQKIKNKVASGEFGVSHEAKDTVVKVIIDHFKNLGFKVEYLVSGVFTISWY